VGLMFIILSLLVLSPGMAKIIPRLPGFSTTIIYAPPSVRFLRGRVSAHIESLHLPHIELQGRQLEKSKICMGGKRFFQGSKV